MKLRITMVLVAGAAMAVAGSAAAQLSPKDAVTARVNGYRETGAAYKIINDQLKAKTPVKIMLRTSAKTIAGAARQQYGWFPAGSGPEAGVKTKVKPAVWTDAAGFKAAQARFQQEADLMVKVVETGDQAQMQKQAKALGATCSACHNKYRIED